MGCNTCNQDGRKKNEKDIKLVPDAIANGQWGELTFLLKIVVFVVITVAIPFIIVVLALQLFLHLFTPKVLTKIRVKWSNFVKKFITTQDEFMKRKRREKREKEFANSPSYKSENFSNVEVVENNVEYEEK